MPRPAKLNSLTITDLKAYQAKRITTSILVQRYHVDYKTIQKWLVAKGVEPYNHTKLRSKAKRNLLIYRDYVKGIGTIDLARKHGISRTSIILAVKSVQKKLTGEHRLPQKVV